LATSYERPVLELAELRRVLEAAHDPEEKAVALLIYDLALRAGEVRGVLAEHLDLAACTVRLRRSKKGVIATVGIAPETARALAPFVKSRGPIFPGWNERRVRYLVRKLVTRAGLPHGPAQDGGKAFSHILRRSRATHLFESGQNVRAIQRRLGHKSPRTTMLYLGMTEEEKRQTDREASDIVGRIFE